MQLYSTPEVVSEPRPVAEAVLATQTPEKAQEGGTNHGVTRGAEDPPEGHDHPA